MWSMNIKCADKKFPRSLTQQFKTFWREGIGAVGQGGPDKTLRGQYC